MGLLGGVREARQLHRVGKVSPAAAADYKRRALRAPLDELRAANRQIRAKYGFR